MKHTIIYLPLLIVFAFASCTDDDDKVAAPVSRGTVTLLCAVSGLGDNGYNDDAAAGVFAFTEESGTTLRLLSPEDSVEARTMYRKWLSENAEKDSAVLIVGSSAYQQMLADTPPVLKGNGSRVLLFESRAELSGVSSIAVSRYGGAWLAGAMSRDADVFLLAAAPGFFHVEEAIKGFCDGHEAAGDGTHTVELQYLAQGEEGFAMPDSAYRVMESRAKDDMDYSEFIFPLIGGSVAGVVSYMNRNALSSAMLVGMDVDQQLQSYYIPFSMVVGIGNAVKQCLQEWKSGVAWPATRKFSLADGMADIVIRNEEVVPHWLMIKYLNEWLNDSDYKFFQTLYDTYRDEALRKEAEYEKL